METIPTDHVGYNVHVTDRFHPDYRLTKGERIYAFFCILVLSFGGLFMMMHSMLQLATNEEVIQIESNYSIELEEELSEINKLIIGEINE
ncbi:hypothetical protein [uncultured Gilliamella sp.]|uniref:hypothetical protein n=1 Tax=uncultured Gilliamella sp. TaxID=1193505 RepID=UPI0025E8BF13|nr:hypothetical protein [uncultured Gilliamella sp.]